MNLSAFAARSRAGAVAALLVSAGLAVAACGGSSPSSSAGSPNSGSTGSANSSTPPAGNSSSPASSTASSVLSLPFPVGVGNTWVYKSVAIGTNATVTDKMTAATPVAGGTKVTMSVTDSLTGTPTSETFIFHSDGSISYPSDQFGSTVAVIKGGILWPPASVIASGQATTSSMEIAFTAGGTKQTVHAHITVKGDGTASVTVPAGTYSATVVQMTESFKIMGYQSTMTIKSWVASGVGPVESEASLDELGHTDVVSHQELVSFTKG
jgi:hypothetical protein